MFDNNVCKRNAEYNSLDYGIRLPPAWVTPFDQKKKKREEFKIAFLCKDLL